jgi:hypothetical protein
MVLCGGGSGLLAHRSRKPLGSPRAKPKSSLNNNDGFEIGSEIQVCF